MQTDVRQAVRMRHMRRAQVIGATGVVPIDFIFMCETCPTTA